MTTQIFNQIQEKYPLFGVDGNSQIVETVMLILAKNKNQLNQDVWDILENHYKPVIEIPEPELPNDRLAELQEAIRQAKINMLIKNEKIDLQEVKKIEKMFEDIPNEELQTILQPHIQRQDTPEINQFLNQNE